MLLKKFKFVDKMFVVLKNMVVCYYNFFILDMKFVI